MKLPLKGATREYIATFSKRGMRYKLLVIAAVLLIVAALLAGWRIATNNAAVDETARFARSVMLATVSTLAGGSSDIQVVGIVGSKSEGQLRTEKAGTITGVYATPGGYVSAGKILAEIANASERASVTQASGSVAAAQANLDKITTGARSEELSKLNSSLTGAQASFAAARTTMGTALLSAYATIDNTITQGTDLMFNNPTLLNPKLILTTSDSGIEANAANARINIQAVLARQSQQAIELNILNKDALLAEAIVVEAELREIKAFLDTMLLALNKSVTSSGVSASDISTFIATTNTARTNIITSLNTITTTKNALNTASTNLAIAEENNSEGVTGARVEDIAAAKASLTQAQGSYAAAIANLEKTRIRAPLSGTLTALSVKKGDFVSAFQDIGTVANTEALEVTLYIPSGDAARFAVGSPAYIDNQYTGVITSIAPGLDPTRRQIEIRVGIIDKNASLPHGSSVTVALSTPREGTETIQEGENEVFIIPIVAIKLTSRGALVFTVKTNDEGKTVTVQHEVTLGDVYGDSIAVTKGLSPAMSIITDARGLQDGREIVLEGLTN